ncbi:plasmid replication initiation protein [Salinibacter ruber]|uniref:Plasmid replication initiation protein n=1 Tax=Salinibacter ruber TaxID=146919 RepID=A0A9X2TDE8_9BACT|nr:replication initiation protein [Salinibacter ruber]MCS3679348.1 plasmid replication initiation protein [Salinibacter ruber]MCS3682634.1 plasmid replication initiation protein [Salinibacter ruber]MCS4155777.1 plasmid replication initiation protein [Salinibacter ruber]
MSGEPSYLTSAHLSNRFTDAMGHQKRLELGAPSDKVVAKANDLIRARHSLSTMEQRVLVMMVAKLSRESEFPVQEIPIHEIADISDIDGSNVYRAAQDICDSLVDQTVDIHDQSEEGNRRYTTYNCFSMCQYEEGKGVIRAKFNEDMRPFLLELKRRFTLYLVTVFLRLRSKYSTQIYELLKMRQGLSNLRMSIEEFRWKLGLEDKYQEFAQMKRRVIEQARGELKKRADIYFTYRVIREGRSAKEIQFYIHENEEVTQELKEEVSALENSQDTTVSRSDESAQQEREATASDSPDQKPSTPVLGATSTEGPQVDGKRMFLEDLSQEEISSLSGSELDEIHEKARNQAEKDNPDAVSSVLAYKTHSRMKELWEDR